MLRHYAFIFAFILPPYAIAAISFIFFADADISP